MKKIKGIVTKDSYYIKNKKYYQIFFSVIIDCRLYIFGEIFVHLKSCFPRSFKKGDNVIISGKIILNSGFYIDALSVLKQT